MKTYNCSFIARSCNGLRSATSELLNLRALLDFQDPSRLRHIAYLHSRLLHHHQQLHSRPNRHCTPILSALTESVDTIGGRPIFRKLSQNIITNDQVCIVRVVCNGILQSGLCFFPAHHEIIMPVEINVSFVDDHNVGPGRQAR